MIEPALWALTLAAILANLLGEHDIATIVVVIALFLAIVWFIKALDAPR